jgi:hypothetical protein
MAYRDEVLTDSPIDYYEMETSTGTDSGSGGRTATLSNITADVAGKVGDGWSFNGTSSKATLSTWYNPSPNYTFEAWVKAPSAQGMTGDYHTIVRRDGTDIVLLRVRGSNIVGNVNPGQLEAYVDGTTLLSGSSYRVDDGNWHHVALTVAGSACKLYVDGVQRATGTAGQTTWNMGTGAAYIGNGSSGGSGEWFKGTMDELALYNTALSAARITAHYNAATGTSITVDADTATASILANEATQESPWTSNGLDETALTITLDGTAWAGDSAQSVNLASGSTTKGYYRITPVDDSDYVGVGLTVVVDVTGTGDVQARPVLASAGNVFGEAKTVSASGLGALTFEWEIQSGETIHGFEVSGPALARIYYFTNSSDVTKRPSAVGFSTPDPNVEVTNTTPTVTTQANDVSVETDATFDASTVTVSALANDATVEGDADTSVSTVTASLSAYDVTVEVSTDPDVTVDVETATNALTAHDVTIVQVATIDVTGATASVAANDVTVEVESNADIELDTPRILTTHIQVAEVQGEPILATESEDPYFASTMYNNPTYWHRFNDITRPPVPRVYGGSEDDLDERAGLFTDAGVDIGLNGGPNARKYVHFDGTGYFRAYEHALSDGSASDNSTLEFSIRTDKQNQFVMRIDDDTSNPGDIQSTNSPVKDFHIKDGKLQFGVWRQVPRNPHDPAFNPLASTFNDVFRDIKWTGYTNIADGEWHHIVVVNEIDPWGDTFTEPRMNVYIDGEFELRRTGYSLGFPDWIAAYPNYGGAYQNLPQSEWFEGDITEVVQYNGLSMTEDRIHVQYDNIFGFQPYYAETARASVKADDATVESNTKRILNIDFKAQEPLLGLRNTYRMGTRYEIDGHPFGFTGLTSGGTLPVGQKVGDYQIFYVDVTLPYTGRPNENPSPRGGNQAYDEETDEPRLLDLEVDVNLDDFDIISVINYPSHSNDVEFYNFWFSRPAIYGGLTGEQQFEKIVEDIKQFAIDGGGVLVSDPAFAADLGVISDVDYVPNLVEPQDPDVDVGQSYNNTKDLRSAVINPWGINDNLLNSTNVAANAPSPVTEDIRDEANFYFDTHANWNQRVVNLVDGLTDIPGDILIDDIAYSGYRPTGTHAAEKWVKRPDGLSIGDEFKMMGTPVGGRTDPFFDEIPPLDQRENGFPATHASDIKAGVMVTAFAEGTWLGNDLIPNPYKDYAVSIAVRPGDLLDGQVMQGRIFVDFTEGFVELAPLLMHSAWDVIPPNEELREDWQEGEYAREWSYSSWRGAWSSAGDGGGRPSGGGETIVVDGDNITITPKQSDTLVGITYTPRYEKRHDPAPTIHYRGLSWLGGDIDEDGNATVGVETARVTTSANEATAESQRSADVSVGTARVITEAHNDADTVAADVTVLVTTPTVTVQAQPYVEAVDLDTARITARSYDDADGITLSGDWVVLRLPKHTAHLTLEDK